MLHFRLFPAAASALATVELMHMIRKGQLGVDVVDAMLLASQFFYEAGDGPSRLKGTVLCREFRRSFNKVTKSDKVVSSALVLPFRSLLSHARISVTKQIIWQLKFCKDDKIS